MLNSTECITQERLDIKTKLLIKNDIDWVSLDQSLNLDLPMFSGIWIFDPFELSGVSGGSVISLRANNIVVSIPETWTRLADLECFSLVMHTPIQSEELANLDYYEDDLKSNLTKFKARLIELDLSDGGARLAKIELLEVDRPDKSIFVDKVLKILTIRATAYSLFEKEEKA